MRECGWASELHSFLEIRLGKSGVRVGEFWEFVVCLQTAKMCSIQEQIFTKPDHSPLALVRILFPARRFIAVARQVFVNLMWRCLHNTKVDYDPQSLIFSFNTLWHCPHLPKNRNICHMCHVRNYSRSCQTRGKLPNKDLGEQGYWDGISRVSIVNTMMLACCNLRRS